MALPFRAAKAPFAAVLFKGYVMKKSIIAAAFIFAGTATAFACTPEELQAKAMELSTKVQTVVAANPDKATEISEEFMGLQTNPPTDVDAACQAYDDLMVELDKY